MTIESVELSPRKFRVAISLDHPNSNGKTEMTVDGFVSPSGVFGIDRRIELEREAKAADERLKDDQLWIVTHLPTGMKIGFQLSFEAARRNIDTLEMHAEEMNVGEFGQAAKDFMEQKTIDKLAWTAMVAEHAAELEFSSGAES